MDIIEICKRPTGSKFETDEVIHVVTEYIKEKKQSMVDINILKGLNSSHPVFHLMYQNQLAKLNSAFSKACQYFLNK